MTPHWAESRLVFPITARICSRLYLALASPGRRESYGRSGGTRTPFTTQRRLMPTKSSRGSASSSSRERIIDYLSSNGGRITSADGRGLTADLAKAAGYRDLGV